VANALVSQMVSDEGVSVEKARRCIYAVDVNGLLVEGMKAELYQKNFLQPTEAIANWPVAKDYSPRLFDVVKHSGATVLIGLSAQVGAFDKDLIRELASHTDRPVIFALSNPTARCETTAQTVMDITGGALMASGSPFPPASCPDGRKVHISQCNNLYIFPGMGLGAIIAQATRVTPSMFAAGSRAISNMVTEQQMTDGYLLPSLNDVRGASFQVALAVAKQARDEGIGLLASDEQLAALIKNAMWVPRYYPYRYSKE
jgi:malate dehydrogenase (oxaloacetate-decarboxylating)